MPKSHGDFIKNLMYRPNLFLVIYIQQLTTCSMRLTYPAYAM